MQFGIMTSTFRATRPTDKVTTYIDQIHMCKEAGFTVLDLNLCRMLDGDTEFNHDDWRKQAEALANEAAKIGVKFVQSHPVYRHGLGGSLYPDAEEEQRFQELCERGIIISGITGVKWAVIHPATAFGYDMLEPTANIALNRKINDSLVELAVKNGLGIAFENMRDRDFFRRYASSPDELVTLVNDYQSESVGVCWDFGHANRNMTDQRRALRLIGAKLKATHVNDNHGQAMDEHLPPYMGNICWEDIMATLKEIHYGGDLIYELSMTANMPMALRISAGRFVKEIGDYLLNL